jgi:hypothetical protein
VDKTKGRGLAVLRTGDGVEIRRDWEDYSERAGVMLTVIVIVSSRLRQQSRVVGVGGFSSQLALPAGAKTASVAVFAFRNQSWLRPWLGKENVERNRLVGLGHA